MNLSYDFSMWWPEDKNSPNVAHACSKRWLKWVPNAWGYSCVTLSPGVINTEAWSWRLGVWHGVDCPTLLSGNSRKAMAHNGLSCQRWWWWWRYVIITDDWIVVSFKVVCSDGLMVFTCNYKGSFTPWLMVFPAIFYWEPYLSFSPQMIFVATSVYYLA
jgi:hypothetical protein